jgi:effector-binding domain-containing protein
MSLKAMIAVVLIAVTSLILSFIYRLGGFKEIHLSETTAGPFHVVSKAHLGPYHKIVPVIEEVEKWAHSQSETCVLSFGEFIDNVNFTPEDRLHSNAGCIVEKNWQLLGTLPEGFMYRELPARRYLTTVFDGAPSIGPMKVYSKAFQYIEEHGEKVDGPIIEMYEILPQQGIKTTYYFPIVKAVSH